MQHIKDDVKEQLLKAQESEMETVVIYRYLAERAKDPEHKNIFLKMASDEGKHAGILRKYSGKTVERKEKPAFRFRLMTRIFGVKMVVRMMLTSEQKNAEAYAPVAKANPAMREILKDERRHVQLLQQIIDKK
ncbi:MAG: ferritin family protein [Bacteroidales bacterium]